jgi:DNA-binding transcriptional regulator LsrR (DeoR family)
MDKVTPDSGKTASGSLRIRAAWLYYRHNITQREIADRLGVSRATVIHFLDEAKKRNEVQIFLSEGTNECVELSLLLEERFGFSEAIVVPSDPQNDDIARTVGAALGRFLSEVISDGMKVGVGWGRTLDSSLSSFHPMRRSGVTVVSLMGGIVEPSQVNPVEFAWRLASMMDSTCMLFLSPLIVDSAETKRALIERCGLEKLIIQARDLDIAVVSCGSFSSSGASLARDHVPKEALAGLTSAGCVGDVMCNFLDGEGNSLDHAIKDRVMSVDLDTVAAAKHLVLASGGEDRALAIRASILRLKPDTFITDERAAAALARLASDSDLGTPRSQQSAR